MNPVAAPLPVYDDVGINLADPHDRRGLKTEYISLLQQMALERIIGTGTGHALDLGCGYGRMTERLSRLGYWMTGMDPSLRILKHAAATDPKMSWCNGKLPQLPFFDASFSLVLLLNVVRVLHLMKITDVCSDSARIVAPGGRLVVLDNIRANHPDYVEEEWFVEFFHKQGLTLKSRTAIRASRWPVIYLIRYGLVPRRLFRLVARYELWRMRHAINPPKWSYHNVIFVFERQ